jgi:choloylglycine hydrolase
MCTNFAYPTAKDGTACIGRTMEFPNEIPWQLGVAASDLKGECTLVPNGKTWQAKYGVVGMSAFDNPQWYADGMNNAGLSAHLLYMPGHATYYAPKGDGSDIGILDVIAFVLGTCSTVAEAKAAAATCNVVNVQPKQIPIPLPLHLILHDKDSCAVVEFHPDGMRITDNPVRVATNSPYIDWHLTNVTNYLSLSPDNPAPIEINGTTFAPFAQGQGFRGIPGDGTAPARFIRALTYVRFAPQPASSQDAELQSIRVLHNFDIVPGTVMEPAYPSGMTPELTIWSTVCNLTGNRYLYNTFTDPQWFAIDLATTDFTTSRSIAFATSGGVSAATI